MAGEKISDLIEQSHIAADDGDIDGARTLALKALVGACKEKDDYLNGLNPGIQEQQLADWFGECSFVFNKVSRLMILTCFVVFNKLGHWMFVEIFLEG